ncbi:HD-GYP domain-containing protein [Cohnella endophytica]|uniref:HD-GYP domain-containing protein n=1 Tax=Cohnella endophytica TaxID=2419778 RepID=A0A494Y191_9BACL|nr:HD-GYP domain-containing protein [Cohnella endophytica]RKP54112.1 HD-GYP domain-containing protein [Cohnella endophytica]
MVLWNITTLVAFGFINFFSYSIYYFMNASLKIKFREDGHLFAWLASLWVGGLPLLGYSILIYLTVYIYSHEKKQQPLYFKNFLVFALQVSVMIPVFITTKKLVLVSPFIGLYVSIMLALFATQLVTIVSYHLLYSVSWKGKRWRQKAFEFVWMDAFSISTFLFVNRLLPQLENGFYWRLSSQAFLLIFVILRFGMRSIGISQRDKIVETMNESQELNGKLSVANNQVLTAFALSLEKRDAYTAGHSERVAMYANKIAIELGVDPKIQRSIYLGGLLHDIGKIGIPDVVLNKLGALTEEEYSIMKRHPVIGEELLRGIYHNYPLIKEDEKQVIIEIVLYHHERPDGKGYPRGLYDDQIPIWSKIVGVADAYDAMTTNRSYRPAMTTERAASILINGSGTQFWRRAVEALVKIEGIEKKSMLV